MPPASNRWPLAVSIWVAAAGCRGAAPPPDASLVAELMQNQYGWIRSERISPPVASRITAYAAIAVYEGLAAGSKSLQSISGQLPGLSVPTPSSRIDGPLVAVAAERAVLESVYQEALPQTKAAIATVLDSRRADRRARGVGDDVAISSEAHGNAIGAAIVAWSKQDGFDSTRRKPWSPSKGRQYWVNSAGVDDYVPQSLSGARDLVSFQNPAASLRPGEASERSLIMNRPKSPGITGVPAINPAGATEPWWGTLRRFGRSGATECTIPDPPAYSEAAGSPLYLEAKATFDASRDLDSTKRKIVLYWADNPGQSGTPPGHWLAIGSQMVSQRRLDIESAAELFLLVSLAQADAFIAAWDVKYRTMVVRPNTYIARVIDRRWQPAIITPAFPEYPSGHSVQSAAVATVMTRVLGDSIAFDDSTNIALGHGVRRFESFWAAAEEAGISRLYGGIHYPMAITNGATFGRCIGQRVLDGVRTRRR